jgi:16S rRNA U516 pseudouridylate synthase RsuA-like enzyme
MFARFSLKVVRLHREAIGDLELPEDLDEGNWVEFTPVK